MTKISFYPLDIEYKIVGERTIIRLYGKTQDGKQICVQDSNFEPYFYVYADKRTAEAVADKLKTVSVEKHERRVIITRTEIVEKRYFGDKIRIVKAYTKFPQDISIIKNKIKDDFQIFESDIIFTRRYLIDKGIVPLVLTDVEGEFINQKSRVSVMNVDSIQQTSTESVKDLRVLGVDIETYNPTGKQILPEENPIIMLALYHEDYKKVFVTKQIETDLDYIEYAESEAELLIKFKKAIEEFKPDILTGYYSDVFDLPYIVERAERNNVRLNIGLDYSDMQVDKRGNTSVRISGIVHLDIFQFIKRIFSTTLETPSFSLDAVSKELLGKEKEPVDIDELHDVYDNHPEKLAKFCEYNLMDAQLTYELAMNLMPNIKEIIKIVGLPMFDATRKGFSQLVEWYLIKRSKDFDELVPNKPTHEQIVARRKETYQGAFVYEPKPGLYEDIVVLDFRSLYPSVIISHNISPDTLNCTCCEGKESVPGEDFWFCKRKKGFISAVIEELITRRMRIKEIMKTKDSKILYARQHALKTIANAMYGYLGFFVARWYCLECAKSITAFARHYTKQLIEKAEQEGFQILYGDTDSVFFTLNGKTREDSERFTEEFNLKLPEMMELEPEGFYSKGIFVSAKMGAYGAKKKYALLNENGNLKITGFESVRRNTAKIAKDIQEDVLNIILRENNPKKAFDHVRAVVDKIKKKEIPTDQMIIFTRLQKNIEDYESIGPHVAVAKRLKKEGYDVGAGTMIRYVVGTEGEKIRDKARLLEEIEEGGYDSEYYINNQVIPVVEKIFEVLGFSKEDLVASLDQKKLDRFFG